MLRKQPIAAAIRSGSAGLAGLLLAILVLIPVSFGAKHDKNHLDAFIHGSGD